MCGEPQDRAQICRPAGGQVVHIPELPEASGLAASHRFPGQLWSHNDSGAEAVLFTLNAVGAVTDRVRVLGATATDWEAIAIGPGPCPGGSCLYIGDIGDNSAKRNHITVYRIPEPVGGEDSVAVHDVFHATYPDGAHDAETLLVTPDGRMLIVTKGGTGPVALYAFPPELRPGGTHRLVQMGQARSGGNPKTDDRITDGAVSPAGDWVVLRTRRYLALHRSADLFAGHWREARRVDLKVLDEPQGEGIALGLDGTIYVAGEGGGRSRPGTFARLTCTLDRVIRP
jgi:hypothetical protein